ncbi:MAG TPA: hypothetical protein VGG83_02780 [Trebonia sp.]
MTGLQFVAAIANSLAWPAAVIVTVVVLRRELGDAFHRIQSLEFPGGRASFATLPGYEKAIAAVAKDGGSPPDETIARREETEFSVLDALAAAAPGQAILYAWGLLEYQLNVASDRVAPDQPHGWPQVARTLEALDNWPVLYPAVVELRRLRDHTARSSRSPSNEDAARYVSVVQELVTTLRASVISECDDDPGGGQ